MKLRWFHIKGYRSIKEIECFVGDFASFVGENNHGKSNIFQALDTFFSTSTRSMSSDDFFRCPAFNVNEIVIEAEFQDLTGREMEKLEPWTSGASLKVSKTYTLDSDKKVAVNYEAIMKVPRDPWLRIDYPSYNDRDLLRSLPIYSHLPQTGRITRANYETAIRSFLAANQVEFVHERHVNPAGFKGVLDGYLPEFFLIPAVKDVSDETKPSGSALLSRILGTVLSEIAQDNPVFLRLSESTKQVKILIEGETPDQKMQEIQDIETKLETELGPWKVDAKIGINPPDVERLFQLGAYIKLNDGITTSPEEKGHGLQRYLIFALMRVWASLSSGRSGAEQPTRSHIFAFEEPELFQHPQMCRATYDALKAISTIDQTLFCTHSSLFVDLEDYHSIVLVRKTSPEEGTKLIQVRQELFEGQRKKQFNMVRFFNPERNELFFARKVVLVEGPTEKALLPLLAKRLGMFNEFISLIDCSSKYNLTLFIDVLNAFKIKYLVVHDEDPIDPELSPGGSRYNADNYGKAMQAFGESEKVKSKCIEGLGKIWQIPGELEKILEVSKNQGDIYGKPLAAVLKFENPDQRIPGLIQDLVREVYLPPS